MYSHLGNRIPSTAPELRSDTASQSDCSLASDAPLQQSGATHIGEDYDAQDDSNAQRNLAQVHLAQDLGRSLVSELSRHWSTKRLYGMLMVASQENTRRRRKTGSKSNSGPQEIEERQIYWVKPSFLSVCIELEVIRSQSRLGYIKLRWTHTMDLQTEEELNWIFFRQDLNGLQRLLESKPMLWDSVNSEGQSLLTVSAQEGEFT